MGAGIGQVAVLSGFSFNILINGLAAAIKRVCPGVACGSESNAPRIQLLLYADDLVILSDNAVDLQEALDTAHNWATAWRFHFSVGPTKSAVMVFGCGHAHAQALHVGDLDLPRVRSYIYSGVTLQERLSWNLHVAELLGRGER